jgi:hypothetical protein
VVDSVERASLRAVSTVRAGDQGKRTVRAPAAGHTGLGISTSVLGILTSSKYFAV